MAYVGWSFERPHDAAFAVSWRPSFSSVFPSCVRLAHVLRVQQEAILQEVGGLL